MQMSLPELEMLIWESEALFASESGFSLAFEHGFSLPNE